MTAMDLDEAFGTEDNGELRALRHDYADFVIVHTIDGRWSALPIAVGHADPLITDSADHLRTLMDDERTRIRLDRMRGEGGTWSGS